MIEFRPATRADAPAIRRLIFQARINPVSLDWRRFVVAVDEENRVLGCGQVKPHRDGSRELASIAVLRERRGQGIGSAIIRRLLEAHDPPVYLTCRARLGGYYERFGFEIVPYADMPPYFRRIDWIFRGLRRILGGQTEKLLVMVNQR